VPLCSCNVRDVGQAQGTHLCMHTAFAVNVWTGPFDVQKYYIRIILLIPNYAVCSFLSLAFTSASLYIETIRDMCDSCSLPTCADRKPSCRAARCNVCL
jgi:Organic solute transporter Ostalpha